MELGILAKPSAKAVRADSFGDAFTYVAGFLRKRTLHATVPFIFWKVCSRAN
jgi:hypothetical protein